jgi:hypothetical protein
MKKHFALRTFTAIVVALFVASTVAGCATKPSPQNRLSCTKAKDAGFFTFMFAAIGLTFRVAKADTDVVCATDSANPGPTQPAPPSASAASASSAK